MSNSKATKFIQEAAENGKFGDMEVVDYIFDDTEGIDQFASSVVFITVVLKKREGNETRNVGVVVKMQQENELVRESMNTVAQFYNEVFMYQEVLPLLSDDDKHLEEICPVFIHGHFTDGEKPLEDYIIMEDLRYSGFRLTSERLFLDYEHCFLAVKKLARFHALSYAAKNRCFRQFLEKACKLKEVHYLGNKREQINQFWTPCVQRGLAAFPETEIREQVMDKMACCVSDPFVFMENLVLPEEPTAVICHGDFCRNNIFFKYENGKPIDVRTFDLATARYCSPAIDLSYFFFLNIPSEIRRERWDELLAAYHESLSSAIPGTPVPSLDVIKTEMRRKAVYAYVFCSFFIPAMMMNQKIDMEEFVSYTQEQLNEIRMFRGGKEATDAIVAVLQDLYDKDCL